MDKETFKGSKSKTHNEKIDNHLNKTQDSVDKVYDYLDNNYDPVMHYKNGAVVRFSSNDGFGYNGDKIKYSDGYTRVEFVDSFGDELVEENGELLTNECAGHLTVEVWGNEFDLTIDTASGAVLAMADMDIKILKKLNNFLNYALNDKLIQQKGEEDVG